jgi:uncharacterized membrane protein YfcA
MLKMPKEPKPAKPQQKANTALKVLAKVSGMGFQMGLVIFAGNQLGSWADLKFSTSFLESIITLLAIVVAIYVLIRQAKKLN